MDLNEVLNYQVEALRELNELLDFEKEVLIKDRASEIPNIVENKKIIAQKLSLLEKKRQEMCGWKKADELVRVGAASRETIQNLIGLTEVVREKGETNLILTKQSLYYIRTITSALNPSKKVTTYGNHGMAQDNQASSIFTTKA